MKVKVILSATHISSFSLKFLNEAWRANRVSHRWPTLRKTKSKATCLTLNVTNTRPNNPRSSLLKKLKNQMTQDRPCKKLVTYLRIQRTRSLETLFLEKSVAQTWFSCLRQRSLQPCSWSIRCVKTQALADVISAPLAYFQIWKD